MRPTLDEIQRYFETFNQLIFEGKLPLPRIRLTQAKTYVGRLSFKRQRTLLRKETYSDFTLSFSTLMDLPEQTVQDTVIHEMIHYYIAYFRLKDTSSHGVVFRRMMEDINARHGRHMSISHRPTEDERASVPEVKPRWRVVAVVKMRDARTGIKVLPSVKSSIASYYQRVSRAPEVHSVALFNCRHPFFNRFPCSSAARVHFVEQDALEEALKDAVKIQVVK
jgi:hypothetical protein